MQYFLNISNLHFALFIICLSILLNIIPTIAAEVINSVRVIKAQKQYMVPQLQMSGTIISPNDARVSAEVSGRVIWVADVGAVVNKGDVLVKIDEALLRLDLRANEAAIKRLETNIIYHAQQLKRFKNLAVSSSTPISQLDEAKSKLAMLDQDLSGAKVVRDRTMHKLARCKVTAPFAGRLVERFIHPGEYVNVSRAVVRLTGTDMLQARVMVPFSVASYLTPGYRLPVKALGNKTIATVKTIVPVADKVSGTIEIRVALSGDHWVVGAPVDVFIPNDNSREVVAVPKDALLLRSDNIYLTKVMSDNTIQRIVVRTKAANDDYVEVIGDIRAGDLVVLGSGGKLHTGQQVVVSLTE